MMVKATDGREAAAAVESSRRRLDQARAREPWTRRAQRRLEVHLERNGFAEILAEAFGEQAEQKDQHP